MRKEPILFYTLGTTIVLYLERDYHSVSKHTMSLRKGWFCEITVRTSAANFDFNLRCSITRSGAYKSTVR